MQWTWATHLAREEEVMHNYRIALSMDPGVEFAQKGLAGFLEQHA